MKKEKLLIYGQILSALHRKKPGPKGYLYDYICMAFGIGKL